MGARPFQADLGSRALTRVRENMDVYDSTGARVGTVERVYLGTASETALARGTAATAPDRDPRNHTLVDDLAAAFSIDKVPDELRERLRLRGFLRVDATGLFAADRYVLPDQIQDVTADRVVLRVSRDQLIAR